MVIKATDSSSLEGCAIEMVDMPTDDLGSDPVPFGLMNATVREVMLKIDDEEQ